MSYMRMTDRVHMWIAKLMVWYSFVLAAEAKVHHVVVEAGANMGPQHGIMRCRGREQMYQFAARQHCV